LVSERVWVLDRVDRDVAHLVEDGSGEVRRVPRRELPALSEGDVVRVPDANGEPDWKRATRDDRLRDERVEEARSALERLRRRDPGGDVKL
jgi:hypothetical protein